MVRDVLILNTFEKRALVTLVCLCMGLAILYTYFVQRTVMHAVYQDTFTQNYESLDTKVGDLTREYLSLKEGVTQERASELGFYDAREELFVSSDSEVVVSLNIPNSGGSFR